jgi:glycosyltransferase involved in cell wall biosynthesis
MKITIISPAYPLRGGIANFTGLLYRQLIKENEVNVVTFSRQYPSFLFPGKTQFEPNESDNKIPAEIILDSINPLNWKKVGKKIKADAPDLLIFAYWMSFFAPGFAKISKIVKGNGKTKILTICHNVIPHEPKPFDKALTKMFFKHVDLFVTLSGSVAQDLKRIIPNAKQKMLFHPVYSIFGESVNKEDARKRLGTSTSKVVLFFGFIRDYKGILFR